MITEESVWHALPQEGWLRRYVNYASQRVDAHIGYHVCCGLTLLSQVTKMKVRIGAIPIRPNFFALLIGDSTDSRKGICIDRAMEILDVCKPDARCENPASRQAIVDHLRFQPHGTYVYGEFGSFLSASEAGPFMQVKTALNDVYDGAPMGNARAENVRAGKTAPVKNHSMSLLGGCDPFYLERHTESVDWTSGFFARFFCMAAKRERDYVIPPDNRVERDQLTRELADLMTAYTAVSNNKNVLRYKSEADLASQDNLDMILSDHFQGFTPDAYRLYESWYQTVELRKKRARFGPGVARTPAMVMKIALLLTVDAQAAAITAQENWAINERELEAAVWIAELHIKSLFELGDLVAEDKWMRMRRQVLVAISPEKPTRMSTIMRAARLSKRDVDQVLLSLDSERSIMKVKPPDEAGTDGLAEPWFVREVNPTAAYSNPVIQKRKWPTDITETVLALRSVTPSQMPVSASQGSPDASILANGLSHGSASNQSSSGGKGANANSALADATNSSQNGRETASTMSSSVSNVTFAKNGPVTQPPERIELPPPPPDVTADWLILIRDE